MYFIISAYDHPYEDIDDEVLKKIYPLKDIQFLIETATRKQLSCLRFISLDSTTYFNQKQSLEIKNFEIPKLRSNSTINQELINALEQIIELVAEGYQFLKIEPLS